MILAVIIHLINCLTLGWTLLRQRKPRTNETTEAEPIDTFDDFVKSLTDPQLSYFLSTYE